MESLLLSTLFCFACILSSVVVYLKFVVNTHWKRRGVPHEAPCVLFGNALSVFLKKTSIDGLIERSYEKFNKYPYYGIYMFHKPVLVINDPDLIRLVLNKEFPKFQDRGFYHNSELDPLSNNLFLMPGKKWRLLRNKISPTFTSTKVKQMFSLTRETSEELVKVCDETIDESDIIDVKDMIGRYTTDNICSIAYGFKNNSLRDPENDFKRYGEMIFIVGGLRYVLSFFAPKVMETLRLPFMPRNIGNFFISAFDQAVKCRRENNMVRKDFLGLLMQLMDKGNLEEDDDGQMKEKHDVNGQNKISYEEALAQSFVFFAAGCETTGSSITYCFYELALNREVQKKLQKEIDDFNDKWPEGLTYDTIMNEMEYLNMVFSESLRKHPPGPLLSRKCVEDFDVPGINLKIEKGTSVIIPLKSIHNNPEYYPDPQKFDPLRFKKENITARNPFTYMPFGRGPRYCIGTRYGLLQAKIALVYLLSHFDFSVCPGTQIPAVSSKESFFLTPAGPVYLRVTRRKG